MILPDLPKRYVDTVFLHCSASNNPRHDDVSVMKQWHLERGFTDVGYHFFITSRGELQKGRDLEEVPAAQQGHNTNSIAICLHGLYPEDFTKEQHKTLWELCLNFDTKYTSSTKKLRQPYRLRFRGHREVSSKLCPVFDYKRWLVLGKNGNIDLERINVYDSGYAAHSKLAGSPVIPSSEIEKDKKSTILQKPKGVLSALAKLIS